MDCDLIEVSGQMVLPLPNLVLSGAKPDGASSSFVASHRLIVPGITLSPRISTTARRRSAPGPGWSRARVVSVVAWHGASSPRRIAR